MTINQRYLTTKQAAEYTGWSESYFNHVRLTGQIKNLTPGPSPIKMGRKVLYDKYELDAWIKRHNCNKKKIVRRKLPARVIKLLSLAAKNKP